MCTSDYVIQLPFIYERFMIGSKPIDKLKLQATKLHKDPAKCGLALMSCLFTAQELVNRNPTGTIRSTDERRIENVQQLDPKQMSYIQCKVHYMQIKLHIRSYIHRHTYKYS